MKGYFSHFFLDCGLRDLKIAKTLGRQPSIAQKHEPKIFESFNIPLFCCAYFATSIYKEQHSSLKLNSLVQREG